MIDFENSMKLGPARERYFETAGFRAGYDERWVRLRAGPIPLRFPNAKGRVRAVRLHDLHHVATGYDTSWTGEAEIGAWEIAAGCGDHVWAWALNLSALAIGLAIAPVRTFRAFVLGRHSQSLYRLVGEYDDALLERTVGELRDELALGAGPPAARVRDVAGFCLWAGLAACTALLVPALLLLWLA